MLTIKYIVLNQPLRQIKGFGSQEKRKQQQLNSRCTCICTLYIEAKQRIGLDSGTVGERLLRGGGLDPGGIAACLVAAILAECGVSDSWSQHKRGVLQGRDKGRLRASGG